MIAGIFKNILQILSISWWILLPSALFFIFGEFWVYYVYAAYLKKQKWALVEIKIPAMIEKTPKAMEQVFAAVYSIYSYGLKFKDKYWNGKLKEDFISFELVGLAGGIHFYIRTPEQYRNLVESAVYSQYPGAEIHEAEDYQNMLPSVLPNEVYDIWGCDYLLAKEDAYPIRTYFYFEEAQKEKRLDPIAAIAEAMSNLKSDESMWIQLLVRPASPDWKKKGEEIRDKLIGRKKPSSSKTISEKLLVFLKNLIIAPIEHPTWGEEQKKESSVNPLSLLSPGEREVVEAVEEKLSKLAFETTLRFIYIDKRARFSPINIAAAMSTFNQFNTQNLNSLRPNGNTITKAKGLFKRRKLWYRKRRFFDSCKHLVWPRKCSILNIEELATLYHFPSLMVEAPMLRHLGAKKGEPPAGLPIE